MLSYLNRIYKIECAVCQKNHVVNIYKDYNDNSLVFEAKKQPFSFSQCLGHLIKIIFNRKAFIEGMHKDFFGLILNKNQIEDLASFLESQEYISIYKRDSKKKTYHRKNYDDTITEYYDRNGIMLSSSADLKQANLSIYLQPKTNVILYSTGYIKNKLRDGNHFLSALKQIIGEFDNGNLQSVYQES